jgi:3-hydroxybutyryl-CoA dehydrogenase
MKIAIVSSNKEEVAHCLTGLAAETVCLFAENAEAVDLQADAIVDFSFDGSMEHVQALKSYFPRPVVVNSVLYTCAELGVPFIRFNGWPSLMNTQSTEVFIPAGDEEKAASVFSALGWKVVSQPDICGFTSARVVGMIVNEAYFALGEGVSTRAEMDVAMKLGTNYPHGPFEWASLIGLENIYSLLKKLSANDTRYRAAPELEQEITGKTNI